MVFCLKVYLCTPDVCLVPKEARGQNSVSDTPELKLQMVMSRHVSAGDPGALEEQPVL